MLIPLDVSQHLHIFTGIGDNFMWVACVVTVSHYFRDKRAFAMGLAICGSGIGTFIFAPLTEYLVDKYTWKGAVLIEAGIMLNCVIGGMFFRPLPLSEKLINKEEDRREENGRNLMNDKKCDDNNVTTNGISKSDGFLYEKIFNLLQPNYRSLPKLEADCHSNYINSNGGDLVLDLAQSSLLPANYKGQNKHNCQTISKIKTGCSYLNEKIGMYMCLDLTFLLFVVSGCFYAVGATIPYIYLADRARDSGMSKPNAAFLLSAAGISNTVARLFFGWLAARSFSNSSYIYGTAIIICGLGTGLSPFSNSPEYLLCYSALFGACAGKFFFIIMCCMHFPLI
jgi:MFS family permease